MKKMIQQIVEDSIDVKKKAFAKNQTQIIRAAESVMAAMKAHRTLFLFGNGGSAADSQHIAAEFIGRFQKERESWPAVALTTDTSILTALSNDYSYDCVFARQLEGLAKKGDVAIGISTSGNSRNVIEGIQQARKMGLTTISLTGGDGGKLAPCSDIRIIVPSTKTARVQESHICILHTICELVEDALVK
ncbi:MAG: D-sedoheptulose 7-phosphate isomerase [Candidatus Omnitrophota bacterium]|nr:D-sedoheptulose 7-phosphate isomerase [Candidatus Omnitrophota bacterium]